MPASHKIQMISGMVLLFPLACVHLTRAEKSQTSDSLVHYCVDPQGNVIDVRVLDTSAEVLANDRLLATIRSSRLEPSRSGEIECHQRVFHVESRAGAPAI